MATVAWSGEQRFPSWSARLARCYVGLSWNGIALVGVMCVVNGLRRAWMNWPSNGEAIGAWLANAAVLSAMGLAIAVPVVAAVVATYESVDPRPTRRYPALLAAVVAASLIGTLVMMGIEIVMLSPGVRLGDNWQDAVEGFLRHQWLRYGTLALLGTAIYVYTREASDASERARQLEIDRERLEQQLDEARLQLLEAQIEPHFLFNTLALLRRLYQTTADEADAILDSLIRYLGVALPSMRSGHSTLGLEIELVEAYLAIQKRRMGDRLHYSVQVPESLHGAPLPPLMLLTLVENAVKHGVAPLPEGALISVAARGEGSVLRVQVADSGRGFVATSGDGTGLANIRARLAAAYGRRATLQIVGNVPRGVIATLTLPAGSRGAR